MAGKHAGADPSAPMPISLPISVVSAARDRRAPSIRRILTMAGSMAAAIGLAASMALPAISASATLSPLSSDSDVSLPVQAVTVNADVTNTSVVRDASSVVLMTRPTAPTIAAGSAGWNAPINRPIVSPWGPRAVICTAGVGCDSGFHRGDDFDASCGTPFYSVSAGVVSAVTYGGLAGDEIVVDHGNGVATAYSHMFDSGVLVKVGQTVTAGENIGLVGSSGDSTGCHIYFEYRVNGLTVDPQVAMAAHGVIMRVG